MDSKHTHTKHPSYLERTTKVTNHLFCDVQQTNRTFSGRTDISPNRVTGHLTLHFATCNKTSANPHDWAIASCRGSLPRHREVQQNMQDVTPSTHLHLFLFVHPYDSVRQWFLRCATEPSLLLCNWRGRDAKRFPPNTICRTPTCVIAMCNKNQGRDVSG